MRRTPAILLACICMLAAQNAMAQSDLGLKALGVNLGIVSPEDVDATVGIGVFADHGFMSPRIKLESHIDFWSKSEDFSGGDATLRDIAIGARGKYMFPSSSSSIVPFAGVGLGLHFLHAKGEVQVPGFPATRYSDSDTKLGLDLGGGIEVPLQSNSHFIAEAWYGIVSDVSQLSLKAGMAWKMK